MNIILQNTTSTSGTVTATDTQQDLIMVHDAGTTATLTIAFSSTPINVCYIICRWYNYTYFKCCHWYNN